MKLDGRTLSHEVSEHIRLMAVRRVAEGESPSAVMESYGLCRTTIYRWLRAARKGGDSALRAKTHPGPEPKLGTRQNRQIFRWVNGRSPRQYGFDFGLWTRKLIQELVQERFGISLGLTAVGRLLAELQITPQKPLRRAYQRDPAAIDRWLKQDYPKLRSRAKRKGAKVFFLDEAGIRSDVPPGRTWAPKGKTPVVQTPGQRQSVNAISAVNARGEFWFKVYRGAFNQQRFVSFLKDFMRGRRHPVFLVVDGHPSHRGRKVAEYVRACRGRLEIHFLPSYAPELNPDEFVWNYVKTHGISKKPLREGESLFARVCQDLQWIKRFPSLVRSFFRAPTVAYTKD